MREDYTLLFKNLSEPALPEGVLERVIGRINEKNRRRAKIRVMFLGFVTLLSFVALVPAFQYATAEFYRTGFYNYVSLLFTDGGIVVASWKEFSLSLVESFPVFSVAMFLSVTFILLASLRLALKNIHVASLSAQHI